jgi:hypothetical protein
MLETRALKDGVKTRKRIRHPPHPTPKLKCIKIVVHRNIISTSHTLWKACKHGTSQQLFESAEKSTSILVLYVKHQTTDFKNK